MVTLIRIFLFAIGQGLIIADLGGKIFGSVPRTKTTIPPRMFVILILSGLWWVPLFGLLFTPSIRVWSIWTNIHLSICMIWVVWYYLGWWPRLSRCVPQIEQDTQKHAISEINKKLQISRATLRVTQIQQPVQIAVVSDMHCNTQEHLKAQATIAYYVRELKPDALVLLGDFAQKALFVDPIVEVYGKEPPPLGTFAVLGNHDLTCSITTLRNSLKENNIFLLENGSSVPLVQGVTLTGASPFAPNIPSVENSKDYCILLAHTPNVFFESVRKGYQLVLSGHTHGGKLHLPIFGPAILATRFGRVFISGWYQKQQTLLFLTRGVSLQRFWGPVKGPEIALLTLTPSEPICSPEH